jgi:hypothetical protein
MSGHMLRRARRAREPGSVVLLFTGAWSRPQKTFYAFKHRLRVVRLRHRGVDPAATLAWAPLDDDERLGHCPDCGDSRRVDAPVCLRGFLSAETVERSAERRHTVPGHRRLLRRHQRVDHVAAFNCPGFGRFPVLAVLADGPAVPGQGPAACPQLGADGRPHLRQDRGAGRPMPGAHGGSARWRLSSAARSRGRGGHRQDRGDRPPHRDARQAQGDPSADPLAGR